MGSAFVPMDESLAHVRAVVDLSGRPHLTWDWNAKIRQGRLSRPAGSYGLSDAKHFLESFVAESRITVHVDVLKAGEDLHHILESVFKALGRALRQAVEADPRVKGIPSTKGKL